VCDISEILRCVGAGWLTAGRYLKPLQMKAMRKKTLEMHAELAQIRYMVMDKQARRANDDSQTVVGSTEHPIAQLGP